jgi:PQQ-dependent dehydrogenase (methanol/ethanol family)
MKFVFFICAVACAQTPAALFSERCALCHGQDGSGTDRGPALKRTRLSANQIADTIQRGTSGGMPAFALSAKDVEGLASFIGSMNRTAFDAHLSGDVAAGARFFFGIAKCGACHRVMGRGNAVGPDLSSIGRQRTVAELSRYGRASGQYSLLTVQLRDGRQVQGLARNETLHSLQLHTIDGKLLLLEEGEYDVLSREKSPHTILIDAPEMPDLLAYLSHLGGAGVGELTGPVQPVDAKAIEQVLHPARGEWPTYNGNVSGNRHSALDQINTKNVARLAMQWSFTLPYFGLEATPLVSEGVMYISGPSQVYALDARSGVQIWKYVRPRTTHPLVPGDAKGGANRGVALLGDRIFMTSDDAHLICVDRLTGALLWDVFMPPQQAHYGSTMAPLVAGDLVIAGVTGADEGMRGFVDAYHAETGKLAWRFWTVPKPGEPGSETWKGSAIATGGGSTWLTGSYDPETRMLYWPTGNPYPDSDGSERKGDNLYTDCILALDVATGKLRWHFQFTPHDLHDWDAIQPPVLVDARFKGRERKLLLHADRNGFFYVLDRTNGELLLAKPFVKKLTWATGIDAKGRPILAPGNVPTPEGTATCPDIRGAANWMSTAYNPSTGFYYVIAIENCGVYRSTDFGGGKGEAGDGPRRFDRGGNFFVVPGAEPPKRYLRAIDIQTGKTAWEVEQSVPDPNYGGVLSTAGGLVFYSESSGAFAAVDAATGKTLWHFQTGQPPKASPITYVVNGRQYVAVASGANVLAFAVE